MSSRVAGDMPGIDRPADGCCDDWIESERSGNELHRDPFGGSQGYQDWRHCPPATRDVAGQRSPFARGPVKLLN